MALIFSCFFFKEFGIECSKLFSLLLIFRQTQKNLKAN